MSTLASPLDAQGPPEAAGPAIEDGAGGLIYGHNQTQRVVHDHARSAEERERDRAQAAQRAHCDHCAGIPDDVLAALRLAFHTREDGRRGR